MTSINLRNLHPSFTHISHLPEIPAEGEVVLLMADPSRAEVLSLSDEESRRASAMASEEARLRFTTGRQLLRSTLSRWLGISPAEVGIGLDQHGKPRLFAPESKSNVQFSIAHSAQHVAVAFSLSEVGLDLESERPVDTHALSKRFFSSKEADAVRESGNADLFFRLWTAREAAIKANGRGIGNLMGVTRVSLEGKGENSGADVVIGSETWRVLHWQMMEPSGLSHWALAFRQRPTLISWCDLR